MEPKSLKIEKHLNALAKKTFKRGRDEGCCVNCGSYMVKEQDFRDDVSRREYQIARLCQKCQDEFYGEEEHDLDNVTMVD